MDSTIISLQGRLGKGYRNQFWLVMLDSLWQSLVIFFIAVKVYEGMDIGIWQFGATIVSSCLVTMLCHFALEVRTWVRFQTFHGLKFLLINFNSSQTIIHFGAIVISLGSFYIFAFVYNTMCTSCLGLPNTAKTIHDAMSSLLYYLITFLTPVLALLPRAFIKTLKNSLRPSDDIVVQVEMKNEQKRGENLLATWSSRSTSKSSIFR